MSRIRRLFLEGPYGQVHLRIANENIITDKPPLICLHQSPKSGREFVKFMKSLTDRTIIAIDNPGHGESDLPPSENEATIANYAKSAWVVIKALDLNTVDLLGNHTGSSVAIEMAHQQPEKVNHIALISCPIYTEDEINTFKTLFQAVPLDEAGSRFIDGWTKAITYRGPGTNLEDMAISFAENYRAGEAYEWGHHAAFENSARFPKRLKNCKHQVIVINPGDLIFDATKRSEPYIQNGEIRDYPQWGLGFLDAFTEDAANAISDALQ